jgi:hypothetical protein
MASADDLDRTTVILPIRPAFLDRIFDGSKTVEFRREPLPPKVRRILPWRTGPAGGVAGLLTLGTVRVQPVIEWLDVVVDDAGHPVLVSKPGAGIDAAGLIGYAGGHGRTVAVHRILAHARFSRVYTAREVGISRAPQNFVYAPKGWRGILAGEALRAD